MHTDSQRKYDALRRRESGAGNAKTQAFFAFPISVIGPSGCGKSTLLSVLMGLLEATSGQVSINGTPMKGPGTDRGIVFQQKSLFPWLTARKNVAFGIEQANPKISRKERFQIADEFLDKVGLSGYEDLLTGRS